MLAQVVCTVLLFSLICASALHTEHGQEHRDDAHYYHRNLDSILDGQVVREYDNSSSQAKLPNLMDLMTPVSGQGNGKGSKGEDLNAN